MQYWCRDRFHFREWRGAGGRRRGESHQCHHGLWGGEVGQGGQLHLTITSHGLTSPYRASLLWDPWIESHDITSLYLTSSAPLNHLTISRALTTSPPHHHLTTTPPAPPVDLAPWQSILVGNLVVVVSSSLVLLSLVLWDLTSGHQVHQSPL